MDLANLSNHGEDDKERLINFLEQTYNFVESLYKYPSNFVSKNYELNILQEKELMLSAWNEFDENFEIEFEKEKIRAASSDTLVDHGLYGAQLTFKLTIIEKYYKLRRDKNYLTKYLKKIIEAIDNLLDSMIDAFGLDGALKELKDAYSTILD